MRAAFAAALLLAAACGAPDPARELYFEALRGEETGLTRDQQIALLDRAIALDPKRASYFELRGGYRFDTREFERARADIDAAIALADRPYLRFTRGLVLCHSGRFKEALEDFDLAVAGQPENGQFYRGRALARLEVGEVPGARADAERLLALSPQMGESHYVMGRVLEREGRLGEAVVKYRDALARKPELVYPRDNLVVCLRATHRAGEAIYASEERARLAEANGGCAYCLDPFRY